MRIWVGTSGFGYKEWRGKFYPERFSAKEMLRFYASRFAAVEINNSFYRLPKETVLRSWSEQVPPEFRFVLKAPRIITHTKRLKDAGAEVEDLFSVIKALGSNQSAILFQLPPNFKKDVERLQTFLCLLPADRQVAFEFRHSSWFTDEVYALLNQFHAGFVINASPHFPSREMITDQIMYIRFHGPGKLYNSLYSQEQLQTWADKIRPQLAQHAVYGFFNNTFAGQALQNANELRDLLSQ